MSNDTETTEAIDKRDAYAIVTEAILTALESGTVPWRKPWSAAGVFPLSMSTKKPYRGINVILLSLAGAQHASPWWGTYKKITEMGGAVRQGEKSTIVTFWKKLRITEEVDGEKVKKDIFMLRYYRVFNADQADWTEGKKPVSPQRPANELTPYADAEAIMAGYRNGPTVTRKPSDQAFYLPSADTITLPELSQYSTADEFYSTAFHELTHSTGHPSRLARPGILTFTHFGSELYSKEELVAEMGAAFLCATAGIDPANTMPNSAAYLASWLRVLKGDRKMIVHAAAAAQRAADHIRGVSFAEASDTDTEKAETAQAA